jgi:hypothetical protein
MKKLRILACLALLLATLPLGPLHAAPPALLAPAKATKGAANLTELGNALFQALQANDFELLTGYLPAEAELALLKKKGSADLRALLEANSAAEMEDRFKTDFQTLVQQAVSRSLNWSDLSLAEARAGSPDPKNPMLLPVELRLQSRQNQLLTIRFEAVRLQNRYFLFRRVEMSS